MIRKTDFFLIEIEVQVTQLFNIYNDSSKNFEPKKLKI